MVKSNKLFKILAIMLVVICMVSFASNVFAAADAGAYDSTTITGSTSSLSDKAGEYGNTLLGIFQVVGYVAAVIVLVWLGIKYIMASPDGKAEIKKQAFGYVLGAVLLFAAGTIVGIIKSSV